jgi:tetratricopeptide (TPR) repeat protein
MRILWSLALSTTLAAGAAYASGGSKPEPPPTTSSGSSIPEATTDPTAKDVSGPRVEAERSYAQAYDEVAKAKEEVDKGKAKNAQKKFKKALEHAEHATALDDNYHEAWNLVGYCARKLGDYDKAFKSYDKCLSIKWDYAPAREYLGEAYLEKGDPKKAHEQLTMLEKSGEAGEESARLFAAIQAYEKVHPEAAAPATAEAPAAATAPADSTSGNH